MLLVRNEIPCGYFKNFSGTNSWKEKKKKVSSLSISVPEHADSVQGCTKEAVAKKLPNNQV